MDFDVVIIGAGPAGLSTAVYLRRALLKVAVVEKEPFSGGQLLYTNDIENYLGFESISGDELSQKFYDHALHLGAEFIKDEAISLDKTSVLLKSGKRLNAKAVVIAAGSAHKRLGAKGEMQFSGRGVSYCAVCDGAFFFGKDVAVIGGGDTALEDAIYLAAICNSVTLVHRRNELRASKYLVQKFKDTGKAQFVLNDEVSEFKGENLLNSIVLKSGKTLDVSGAFVAVGQAPQDDFVPKTVKRDADGYFITDEFCQTNADSVFAVGDIRQKNCRQIATAVADGAIASRKIIEICK